MFRELFCLGKKFLVYNMVGRNLKVKYRRSVLGVFWTLMVPLSTGMVFYFVFKFVLNTRTENYVTFVLFGNLCWSFFGQSLGEGSDSILGNAGLSTKIPIPVQIFPLVANVTNWITLVLGLPVVMVIAYFTNATVNFSLLTILPFFAALFVIAYSVSLIFGIAFVYFRDLRHLIGVLMQIWFYSTPVLYPVEQIPEAFRKIIYLNPLGTTFAAIHEVLPYGRVPQMSYWIGSFAWSCALLLLAAWVLKKHGKNLAELY